MQDHNERIANWTREKERFERNKRESEEKLKYAEDDLKAKENELDTLNEEKRKLRSDNANLKKVLESTNEKFSDLENKNRDPRRIFAIVR